MTLLPLTGNELVIVNNRAGYWKLSPNDFFLLFFKKRSVNWVQFHDNCVCSSKCYGQLARRLPDSPNMYVMSLLLSGTNTGIYTHVLQIWAAEGVFGKGLVGLLWSVQSRNSDFGGPCPTMLCLNHHHPFQRLGSCSHDTVSIWPLFFFYVWYYSQLFPKENITHGQTPLPLSQQEYMVLCKFFSHNTK